MLYVPINKTINNKQYRNLDVSYLSDSYGYKKYLKFSHKLIVERPATANVEFEKESTKIKGYIEIIYKDFCKLRTEFVCEQNGVVEFENISYDIDSIENELDEIKSLLYVLVKTLIHGDSHHHQKIDVALPVVDNAFEPSLISSSLLDYIKLVERNIKNTKSCQSLFRHENLVFEIEGYLSYFKSFTLLFDEVAVKEDFEFAKSVVASLKSTVAKRKNKVEFFGGIVNAAIAFLGLFIATNILLNSFWAQDANNISNYLSGQDRFYYLMGSLLLILALFFKYTLCKIASYIYYSHYGFSEFLTLLQDAKFSELNYSGKFLKLIPVLLVAGSILIFILSRMQDSSYI